nr:tripartite tricarboxylate transporter substrate-binding protein [Dankookia rubra]
MTGLATSRVNLPFAMAARVADATSNGRLCVTAVTSAGRLAAFPGVFIVAEVGLPGCALEGWHGICWSAGIPRTTVKRLNAAASQAVRTEAFQRQVAEEGITIVSELPA